MMLKIIYDHVFGYFSRSDAKKASSPKMPSPVSFLQLWKLFKQFTGRSPFYPAHYFTGCHCWWRRHKYVNMVLTDHSFDDSYFKMFTRLPNQLPDSKGYISSQHLVTIFGHPYRVLLNVKNSMAPIAIIHKHLHQRIL